MNDRTALTITLFVVLIPLQIAGLPVVWAYVGSVNCVAVASLCLFFNLLALALLRTDEFWLGIVVLVVFGLALVWWQVNIAMKLHHVGTEAANIVFWAHSEKEKRGHFPADMDDYRFRDPRLRSFITRYEVRADDSFTLAYTIGWDSTHRWYDSRSGWIYYPD